jgi:hypothetical protein
MPVVPLPCHWSSHLQILFVALAHACCCGAVVVLHLQVPPAPIPGLHHLLGYWGSPGYAGEGAQLAAALRVGAGGVGEGGGERHMQAEMWVKGCAGADTLNSPHSYLHASGELWWTSELAHFQEVLVC